MAMAEGLKPRAGEVAATGTNPDADGVTIDPRASELPLDLRARELYPTLYANIFDGHTSWLDVARARDLRSIQNGHPRRRGVRSHHDKNADERRRISNFLEGAARKHFEGGRDSILKEFWSDNRIGCCALTASGRLHSLLNTWDAELVYDEEYILQLNRDAQQVFNAKRGDKLAEERLEAAETLYPVLARIVWTADRIHDSRRLSYSAREGVMQPLRLEMRLASDRVRSLIQRQARFEYFLGVLIGAVATIVLFSLLGWLALVRWPEAISVAGFTGATIAGTIGAVVSVTQRIATNNLTLDFTAPRAQKMFLGGVRALMGAIFAAIVYFALLGGMLSVHGAPDPAPTPAAFAFFSLAGFAAGFSERLATDVLERAGATINAPPEQASTGGSNQDGGRAADGPPQPLPREGPPGSHSWDPRSRKPRSPS
jgi:hypothetical protein